MLKRQKNRQRKRMENIGRGQEKGERIRGKGNGAFAKGERGGGLRKRKEGKVQMGKGRLWKENKKGRSEREEGREVERTGKK